MDREVESRADIGAFRHCLGHLLIEDARVGSEEAEARDSRLRDVAEKVGEEIAVLQVEAVGIDILP